MALGNRTGRPRSRELRSTARRVKWHFNRMKELIEEGYSRDDASKKAYNEIINADK